jgi:hypothetical protein
VMEYFCQAPLVQSSPLLFFLPMMKTISFSF